MTPAAAPAGNTGLQTLFADGLHLEDDEPQSGPVIVSGFRVRAPKPCGAALLREANPDRLIESLIRHCTVDGYTSWPAVATAMEAALRELHAEARAALALRNVS